MSGDAETLAEVIRQNSPASKQLARIMADAVLASDWLAAVRAEAGAKTLEYAADEMVWRPQWGRDDYRRWLRDRAAARRAAQPTEGES